MNPGSRPAWRNSHASIAEVVVFPWVPETTKFLFPLRKCSFITSGNEW